MKEYTVTIRIEIPVSAGSDAAAENRMNLMESVAIEAIAQKGWKWHGDMEPDSEFLEID